MKITKRILSVLLTLVMLLTALPLSSAMFSVSAAAQTIYNVGDILTFGSYPQSKVTNAFTINALNGILASWKSYGYYSGTGGWDDGNMTASDYMKYKDVTYGGNKYRAVTFSSYRPYLTGYTSSAEKSDQDGNGYYTNTTYWFKYEPIQWRVLDPAKGLVMCETIIDSQPYNNTIYYNGSAYYQDKTCGKYANDYATSTMRAWLNSDFYNTAFSTSEKSSIFTTTLDNSSPNNSTYNSASTTDKIFLLSYNDVLNPAYGFSSNDSNKDTARRGTGSDYAKAQGLWNTNYGSQNISSWFLRSPGNISCIACFVIYYGYAGSYIVSNTDIGVRPALSFNLQSGNLTAAKKSAIASGEVQYKFYDKENESLLKNTKVTVNGKEYTTDKEGSVTAAAGSGDVKIEKSGYNNYSFSSEFITKNKKTIYLTQNTTKTEPYVSSVHVRSSGSYSWIDIGCTELKVRNDAQAKYDVAVYVEWNGYTRSDEDEFVYLAQKNGKALSADNVNGNSYRWTNVTLSDKFDPSQSIYAYCVGYKKISKKEFLTSGTYSTKMAVDKATADYSQNSFSLLGNGLSWTLDDDIPIIGGGTISLGELDLPITVDIGDDNSIRIAVGIGTYATSNGIDPKGKKVHENTYDIFGFGTSTTERTHQNGEPIKYGSGTESVNKWTKYKDTISDISKLTNEKDRKKKLQELAKDWGSQKKATFWSVGVTVSAAGYIEGYVTDKGWVFTEVNINAGVDVSAEWTKQFLIAPCPIPFYVKAGLNGGIKVDATWDRQLAGVITQTVNDWNFDITLSPSIGVTLGVGAGVAKCLCVELDGSASYLCDIRFVDKTITNNITLKATVLAKAFLLKYEKDFAEKTWKWRSVFGSSRDGASPTAPFDKNMASNINEDLYNDENYQILASRDYLNKSSWLGDTESLNRDGGVTQSGYETRTLMSSIYDDSRQQMVVVGGTKMLFWIMDNPGRDSQDRTMLVYSKYDAETDLWSSPLAVSDDTTADFAPDVVSDGEKVYIAWQNMKSTFGEDVILENYAASSEIAYAVYDSATDTFTVSELTDNAVYDAMPQIAVDNGNAVVSWVENSDNDAFLQSTANKINLADISNGEVKTVASTVPAVTSFDMYAQNGTNYIAYACDEDTDYNDQSDNEIHLVTVDGDTVNSARLTENEYLDSAPYFGNVDGEAKLFWYANNNYVIYDLATGEKADMFEGGSFNTDSYTVVTSESEASYIIWSAKDGVGHVALYASVYEDGEWSEAVQIGIPDGKITSPTAVIENSGLITIACNSTQQTLAEGEDLSCFEDGDTDLIIMSVSQYADLTVSDESFLFDYTTVKAGDTITIPVTISNSGTTAVDTVDIYVNDEVIKTETVNLLPGQSTEVEASYTFPAITEKTDVTVKVLPADIDLNESDNEFTFSYGYTELAVSNAEIATTGLTNVITATVENLSTIDCGALTVNIREDSPDGTIVSSEEYTSLSPDEIIDIVACVEIQNTNFDESGKKLYYIEAVTDDEEYSKGNNDSYVYFREGNNTGYDYGVLNTLTSESINVLGYVTNNEFEAVTLNVKTEIFDADGNRLSYDVKNVEIGAKETYSVNEEFQANTAFSYATITVNPECEHSFGDWTTVTPVSCIQDGERTRICTLCEFIENETLLKEEASHDYNDGEITTSATCTQDGVMTFTCSVCGDTYTQAINAKGHTEAAIAAVPATCETTGSTAGMKCSVCGQILVAPTEIPALGHIAGEWIVDSEADCTNTGSKHKECTICGKTVETQTIDAKGHSDADDDGICDNCNTRFKNPEPTIEPTPCTCNCHKTGIVRFFFGFILFFQKIFGKNKICACGVAHY